MTDQGWEQESPQGRDRLARRRDEDDLVKAEEGRGDRLRGRTVEGHPSGIPGGNDTELQTNRRMNTMNRERMMIRKSEARK